MRSKTLLFSNIFATLYSAFLLSTFGGAIIEAGGVDYIYALNSYFAAAFNVLGMNSPTLTFLYVILILLCAHIVLFSLGCLFGWIAYIGKRSGGAKFAAFLYLLGTVAFPVYLFFGLPICILGFVGGSKQKKINQIAQTT